MKKNNESKSNRFKRLAEKRTKRVLEDIRILSNLANKGLYSYTSEQLRKIFSAIEGAFSKARSRFKGKEKRETEFKL